MGSSGNPRVRGTRGLLAGLVRPRWRAVSVLAGTSILGGLLEAGFLVVVTRTAVAIADQADDVSITRGIDLSQGTAVVVALVLIALRLGAAVATAWQSARLASALTAAIRLRLGRAFLRASWSEQSTADAGRLQELLTTFANQGAALVAALARAITAAFNLLALVAVAVAVDPAASVVLVAASVALGLVLRPLRSAIRGQGEAASESGMSFATALAEVSGLGLEMHVFGVQAETEARVTSLVRDHARTQRRLRFLQGLMPALYTGLAYLAIVAGLAVISQIDGADLGSVGAVMLLMLRSLSYGQGLQVASASTNAGLPFLETLELELQRYETAPAVEGSVVPEAIGRLEFENVSFAYGDGTPVLRDVTFEIEPAQVIGIVGPSGSGKSTLVQLLLGLREPFEGRVLCDGVDLRLINRERWARGVTFVPQDAQLLRGTVADNIRFLRDRVDAGQIEDAARLAHLHEDIESWPEGYSRFVAGNGKQLSGGQRQRLVIARALVDRPQLLILDEPTSALDVKSEMLIRQTLEDLRKSTTIVIIAHRLSTLDICDRIMVIQDGEMKAFDTPERLEQSSDFYREALELSGLR